MNIDIVYLPDLAIDEKDIEMIKNIIKYTLNEEAIMQDVEICVSITDDKEILNLNKRYRRLDKTTDVLSFSANDLDKPYKEAVKLGFKPEKNILTNDIVLGDIAISLDKARQQARQYGHSLQRELGFLTLHGMLHLLGYDHIDKKNEKIMREKQRIILDKIGFK